MSADYNPDLGCVCTEPACIGMVVEPETALGLYKWTWDSVNGWRCPLHKPHPHTPADSAVDWTLRCTHGKPVDHHCGECNRVHRENRP